MTRIAGWLYTGPLGHLYANVRDWVDIYVAFRRSQRTGAVASAGGVQARKR